MNMQNDTDAVLLSPAEYQSAADELDRLWGRPTTPGDRLEIERLLRLIEPCDAISLKYLMKK
ncbi:MAG: hypothetical protein V4488_05750 [Pseudomonadota bacterium]